MDAGAAAGGMKDDAGEGVGVVGEAGALIGGGRLGGGDGSAGQGGGGGECLALAGGKDGDAEGIELKAEAVREGEGDVFLEGLVGCGAVGAETGASVVSTVRGVKEDELAGGGDGAWCRGLRYGVGWWRGCGLRCRGSGA